VAEALADSVKQRRPLAKLPLPKFASDLELAEYFETHSVAGIWDQLPEARPGKPTRALLKKIGERHAGATEPKPVPTARPAPRFPVAPR
jgi:hypothetical protein